MAHSSPSRKRKPQRKPEWLKTINKIESELKELLTEYGERTSDLNQVDLGLRARVHRTRLLLIRESHPDLYKKYLGEVGLDLPISEKTRDEINLNLFGFIMTKNHAIKEIMACNQGPVEACRAMYQLVSQKKDKQHLRSYVMELETRYAQLLTEMMQAVTALMNFGQFSDILDEAWNKNCPEFDAWDNAVRPTFDVWIESLPQDETNLNVFKEAEKELETIIVAEWEMKKEGFIKELEAREKADAQTQSQTTPSTQEAVEKVVEHEVIIEDSDDSDVDAEVSGMTPTEDTVAEEAL